MRERRYIEELEEDDDNAMVSEAPGGIDLNPKLMNIEKRGSGAKIEFPAYLKELPEGGFEGFVPIIINVTPVTNIPMLLGQQEEEEHELLSLAK